MTYILGGGGPGEMTVGRKNSRWEAKSVSGYVGHG